MMGWMAAPRGGFADVPAQLRGVMNRRELIHCSAVRRSWSALAHAQFDKRPVKIGLVPLGSPDNT
jgi:hypothetical protein